MLLDHAVETCALAPPRARGTYFTLLLLDFYV